MKSQIYKKIGRYQLTKEIGVGSFARVYQARAENSDEQFAVKMISKNQLSQENIQMIDKEIEILLTLNHPNIIKLVDFKKTKNNMYLIFEFCEFGDLEKYMKNHCNGQFQEGLAQKIIKQISKGIKEMHEHKIVHRDLKLANILINKDFIVKLGDFGLAKYMEDNNFLQSYCGTPITMAIEILKREKYNEKCDIWSMGVIIYQMLYGYPPFNPKKGGNINDLINLIEKNEIKLPDEVKVSNEAKDLIKKMLVIDPEKRISFQDFFQHPWISVKQKDPKQEKEEYQTLLKSAYNSKSSQGDSNKGSKSSQKNQNQNEEKKLDDFSNLNPKMFMHSSVEDEKVAVNFTADQVNEYLGMTIRQKIRNNFDKYMKFVEEFLEMIEEAKKIGNYQILFLGSLFLMRNSFVMFMNKLEIDVENKNIEFQLPYIQEYQDKLKEVCKSLVPNLQNKKTQIEDLNRGQTVDLLYKYIIKECRQILEEELNEGNELNIQKYKLYLNLIKLLKKTVSIVQKYEISINKYTKDILDLIDQEKIQKDYLLTDQEINQSTFSRQIFDLFEFESQSGEKQKFQIISQKELEQQQNYLIQRIQYVKNKSQISDMEGTGNEGQKTQLAEQGQILQENIFQKKQNTNQQTNLDDNGYDLDGFDPNYKM